MMMVKKWFKMIFVLILIQGFPVLRVNADINYKNLTSLILGDDYSNVSYEKPRFSYGNNDKGLYVAKDDSNKTLDGREVYYYRGAIENNYVQFGTYSSNGSYKYYDVNSNIQVNNYSKGDPILWRIVRINEDESIRLISEMSIENIQYDNTEPFTTEYKNSNLEKALNDWYGSNINAENDKMVVSSDFCNDVSNTFINRKSSPTFVCPTNGIVINSKVGTISSDEMVYAGIGFNRKLVNNYIYNGTEFWTMTPYNENSLVLADEQNLDKNGIVSNTLSARPVINLKNNVTATGSGTKTDPYIINNALGDITRYLSYPKVILKEEFSLALENYGLIYHVNDEDNNLKYTWTFSKENIKKAVPFNLELKVDKSEYKNKIEKISKSKDITYLTFENNTEFPGRANIEINLENKYDKGATLWLYYYNEETNKLEYTTNNLRLVEGKINLEIEKGGDYILTNNEISNKKYSQLIDLSSVLIVVLVLISGAVFAYIYAKKNSKSE